MSSVSSGEVFKPENVRIVFVRIKKPESCKLRCMARIWNKEGKFLLFDVDKGNHDDAASCVIVINNIFKENLVSAFCCGACFVDCVVMTLKAKKDLRRFGNVKKGRR